MLYTVTFVFVLTPKKQVLATLKTRVTLELAHGYLHYVSGYFLLELLPKLRPNLRNRKRLCTLFLTNSLWSDESRH